MQDKVIPCPRVTPDDAPGLHGGIWDTVAAHAMVMTADGGAPCQKTTGQTCYSPRRREWYVRFDAEDEAFFSDYHSHDDLIWEQDVFEMFYNDTFVLDGEIGRYKELESSPRNVQFDTDITWTPPQVPGGRGPYQGNLAWNPVWHCRTEWKPGRWTSVWTLPFDSLDSVPAPGVRWPVNFYRIDRNAPRQDGLRDEFQAWAPTGMVNYHMPDRFGWVAFE